MQWRSVKLLRWSTTEPGALVLSRPGRFAGAKVETTFHGKSGVSVPVLANFRYAMAPPLSYLPPFRLLADLDREGLLTKPEAQRYREALGTRALSLPYDRVLALIADLLPRVAEHVVPETREDPRRAEFLPSAAALNRRCRREMALLRARLIRVSRFAAPVEPGCRVLEVGFTDAHSIAAWARLGFRVTGVDNAYDGTSARPTLHEHVCARLGTKPAFEFADMTKRTHLPEGSFDIIYSVSVLEHLSNVAGAFTEMHRLLRPGGLMIHGWNPYFSPNGGHPWGLLDTPWGHLVVPQSDLNQYIDELRPLEAEIERPWLWRTLDRSTSLGAMQKKVVAAGFRLLLWDQIPDAPDVLGDLGPQILSAAQANYPDLTLADLATRDGLMVARKI